MAQFWSKTISCETNHIDGQQMPHHRINVNLPHSTPTMQYMAYVACLLVFFCRSSYYHDHRCRLHDHHSDQNHHQLNVGYGWGVRCVPKQHLSGQSSRSRRSKSSRGRFVITVLSSLDWELLCTGTFATVLQACNRDLHLLGRCLQRWARDSTADSGPDLGSLLINRPTLASEVLICDIGCFFMLHFAQLESIVEWYYSTLNLVCPLPTRSCFTTQAGVTPSQTLAKSFFSHAKIFEEGTKYFGVPGNFWMQKYQHLKERSRALHSLVSKS